MSFLLVLTFRKIGASFCISLSECSDSSLLSESSAMTARVFVECSGYQVATARRGDLEAEVHKERTNVTLSAKVLLLSDSVAGRNADRAFTSNICLSAIYNGRPSPHVAV